MLFWAKKNAHRRTPASGSCSGMRGKREVTRERREVLQRGEVPGWGRDRVAGLEKAVIL